MNYPLNIRGRAATRAPPVPVVIYSLSNCDCVLCTLWKKNKVGIWDLKKKKNCFILFSFAFLSSLHLPIPGLPPSRTSPLPAWPAPPRHSPIALRPLFCNSCRLQLCTSFLCSLLVRYRYRFSLSLPALCCRISLSLCFQVEGCLACWLCLSAFTPSTISPLP